MSVEFDINDRVSIEAVELFRPDLIVAPFLKRAIPQEIWANRICLVVHPGIRGDRGPSALDWAILNRERHWGVTVIQANGEMDAGDIWASVEFPMREATKASLYRNEVTEGAVTAVLSAVARLQQGDSRRSRSITKSIMCAGCRDLWFARLTARSTGSGMTARQYCVKSAVVTGLPVSPTACSVATVFCTMLTQALR